MRHLVNRWSFRLNLVVLLSCLPFVVAGTVSAHTDDPAYIFINELHYDNEGGDVGEFVEVAGLAGTDLTDWSIVLYNGSTGATYGTIHLTGIIPNEGDSSCGVLAFSEAGIQNGTPDGLALVNPSGTVIQFLSYEGAFTAIEGSASGLTSTDIGVSESGSTPADNSLQLIGSGDTYQDFTWTGPVTESPGTLNTGQTMEGCTTLPVTLAHFESQRDGDVVNFEWVTATEVGNAGFNILAETGSGKIALNTELIPSLVIDSVEPVAYTYAAVTEADLFWIQEVSIEGVLKNHGPFALGENYGESPQRQNSILAIFLPFIAN